MLKHQNNVAQGICVLILVSPLMANSFCLNPFGCDPKTEAECISGAAYAKTESAAKAIISECRKLPSVTLSQCREAERQWAKYMTTHSGVEWDWPNQTIKLDCRILSPTLFSPKLWVTPLYCKDNFERLAKAGSEIDAVSLKSLKVEKARRANPELSDLSDRSVIRVLQATDYSDMSNIELARAAFIDAPPDILAVALECKRIAEKDPK